MLTPVHQSLSAKLVEQIKYWGEAQYAGVTFKTDDKNLVHAEHKCGVSFASKIVPNLYEVDFIKTIIKGLDHCATVLQRTYRSNPTMLPSGAEQGRWRIDLVKDESGLWVMLSDTMTHSLEFAGSIKNLISEIITPRIGFDEDLTGILFTLYGNWQNPDGEET